MVSAGSMTGLARGSLRIVAIWATAFAVLLAVLLPASVMPHGNLDTGLKLVLCTGHGPVSISFDVGSGAPVKPEGEDGQRCKWACCHAFATAPGSPELLARSAFASRSLRREPIPLLLHSSRATGLPPSTGPPLIDLS